MSGKQKWIADGGLIDIESLESIIYLNPLINRFLNEEGWMFLSANKGMGKTLILSYKRVLISRQNPSALLIPKNRPFLDNMGIIPELSKEKGAFLAQNSVATRVWILCIKLSVLTFTNVKLYKEEEEVLGRLPNSYFNSIINIGSNLNPTLIFGQLVSSTPKEIISILERFSNTIDIVFNRIKSEIHVFIDRVDQALRQVNQQSWIIIQGALLEASWIIFSSNNHVKIHASIRQEAYSNYHSPAKENFGSSTMTLKYSNDELIEILNKLAKFYENTSLTNFLGQEIFLNKNANQEENVIHFILRHTLNRPRHLVKICSQLSLYDLKRDAFIEIVTETCNTQIIPNVFDEVSVFMNCLSNIENRKSFFSMLPYNVLTYEDITSIFCEFNNSLDPNIDLDPNTLGGIDMEDTKLMHPFKELYKAGLLGYVNEENIQKFTQPFDLQNFQSYRLPKSKYYLLHPALRTYISNNETKKRYGIFKYIIIGHNDKWDEFYNHKLISVQSCLFKLNDDITTDETLNFIKNNLSLIASGSAIPLGKSFEAITKRLDMLIESNASDESVKKNALRLFYVLDEIAKTGRQSK
jgi:hypothetical protein